MATAKATTNHDEIRKWVEARKGHPARVKATGRGKDPGILRIDFPGFSGEATLEEIEWDEFFEWFDRNNLALLLSSERGNRFNKLVARPARSRKSSGSSKKSAAKKSSSRRVVGSSSKKASSAKKSSSPAKKKSSAPAKKSSGSTKKSSGSTKKAATSSKKASSSTKKASSAKKAAPSKKAAATKKAASSKKAPSKKSTTKSSATTRRLVASKTPSRKAPSKKASSKKASSTSSKTTIDHDEIRKWVESRGGFPATVAGTEQRDDEAGVLRIDYPGFSGAGTLERIEWDDWFEKFDEEDLAFLYQDKRNSRFSKLVRR